MSSLLEQIETNFYYWWHSIHEFVVELDILHFLDQLGPFSAIILNVLYLAIKYYRDGVLDDPQMIIFPHMTLQWEEGVLFFVSVANTVHLFLKHKPIILLKQPTQKRYEMDQIVVKSRNARLVELDLSQDGSRIEKKWMISPWNPSKSSLLIFCWFSPAQLLILYCTNQQNWPFMLPIAYLVAVFLHLLASFYTDLVNDTQIITGQILLEFTENLRNFSPKKDSDRHKD